MPSKTRGAQPPSAGVSGIAVFLNLFSSVNFRIRQSFAVLV